MDKCRKFVVSSAEKERHIAFFKIRKSIWDTILEKHLDNILSGLLDTFPKLTGKFSRNSDSEIHLTIAYRKHVSEMAQSDVYKTLAKEAGDSSLHHMAILLQTVGKYAFIWYKQSQSHSSSTQANTSTSTSATTSATATTSTDTSTSTSTLVTQPDSGLLVLASGCVGSMFRLYRRNKKKYREQLVILSKLIIPNKDKLKSHIPVEQRSRDRGNFYTISTRFLLPLRLLDEEIRRLCLQSRRYGKHFVKEVYKRLISKPWVHDAFNESVPAAVKGNDSVPEVIRTLVRKYVNARIGGFIAGRAEEQADRKGSRVKGGGTLREKLTHVVKTQTQKGKSRKMLKME